MGLADDDRPLSERRCLRGPVPGVEAYCKANPQSATSRFVLAYHYLTEGYLEAAAKVLKQVVALKPSDTISAKLLEQLEAAQQNQAGVVAVPLRPRRPGAANATRRPKARPSRDLEAKPRPDTSIALTIQPGGAFAWQVTQKGQTQQFAGVSTFGGGVLTLARTRARSGRSRELEGPAT